VALTENIRLIIKISMRCGKKCFSPIPRCQVM